MNMTNKLILPVESRMQGDLHVRFGGRLWETYHRKVARRPLPSLHQKVVYESDQYGNATQGGQMYAYFFVGRQGDMMIFEQRSLLDHSNPFIVNMENVLSNYTGIKSTRMLVSNDYKTLNICHYDANNKLVRTRVYNYVDPQKPGAVEIPDLIR